MTNLTDCERHVIELLISVLRKTLSCHSNQNNGNGLSNTEGTGVEKILQILLTHNETLSSVDYINDSLSANFQEDFMPNENSTDFVTALSDTPAGSKGDGKIEHIAGTNKLHKLEIIKVFVLIAVISIIMLTTCRMVFQLFIRFRPEKPPLA